MILGFVIDEQGNLMTREQFEQFQVNLNLWFVDYVAAFEEIVQACRQAMEAITEFADAIARACDEYFGLPANVWQNLIAEPDQEYIALAYQRYAHWYNARHPGRRVSWRRLSADQRLEAQLRFADAYR